MADSSGFHIASGWISVDADTSGFQSQVDAAVQNAGGTVIIPVEPDASGFSDQVSAAVAGAGGDVIVPVDPDASGFSDEVDAAVSGAGGSVSVPVVPDAAGFSDEVDAAVAGAGGTVTVPVEPDASGFQMLLDEQVGSAGGGESVSIPVTPDATGFGEELAADVAGAGGGGGVSVPVTPDTSGFGPELTAQTSSAAQNAGSQSGGIFGNAFIGGTTFGKGGAIVTGVGAALATLPALAGIAGVAMGGIMAAKMAESILAKNPQLDAAFKAIGPQMMETLQKAVAPLVPIVLKAVGQVAGFLKQIEPQLKSLFSSIGPLIMPVLHALEGLAGPLIGFFKAAVQGLQPLITGLLKLVSGVLPGLTRIVSAVAPVMGQFAGDLGKLGDSVGGMLKAMAPAAAASMKVLGAIMQAIGGLLPVIGKLAGAFATSLAPVITALMGAFKALEPSILVIGKVLGALAGAVLTSISGVLVTLGNLLKATAPAFAALAKAVSNVFTVLENRGVLFDLENAIEKIAGPLGKFVTALVNGLVPILPPLIGFLGKVAGVLTGVLSSALSALLPPLTKIVAALMDFLEKAIVPILPVIEKLLGVLAGLLVKAVVPLIAPLGQVVTMLIGFLTKAITPILPAIGQLAGALVKIIGALTPLLPALMPIVTLLIKLALQAITPLIPLIVFLAGALTKVAGVVAIVIGWIVKIVTAILGFIGNLNNLKAALSAVASFFTTAWNSIYSAVSGVVGRIGSFLTNAWAAISSAVKTAWNAIASFFTAWWNAEYSGFTTILNRITGFLKAAWVAITGDIKSAWNAIDNWLRSWWNTITGWITGKVAGLVSALKSAWNNALSDVRAVWNNIQNAIQNVWTATAGWVTGHIDTFLGAVKSKWQSLLSDAQQAWQKLEGIFKAPVNFLIQTVYMGGIRRLWDDVVGAVGASGLDLPAVASLAGGGRITDGTGPTADDVHIRVSKGETVVSTEHSQLPYMRDAFKQAGVPGYAGGGKVGNPAPAGKSAVAPDTSGGILGEAEAIAKMVLAASTGNIVAFTNAFTSAVSPLFGGSGAAGNYASLMVATPVTLVKDAVKGAWKKLTEAAAGGAGGDIAKYARTFLGTIPYTWGGTSFSGDDCCLIGSMRVQTTQGPREIRDIRPGDAVWTWNDGKPAVSRVTYRSEPRFQQVYRLRTVHREITASGNHPFLTLRNTGRVAPPEPRFPQRERLPRPHNRRERIPVEASEVAALYLSGASLSETAGALGVSMGTVISRLDEAGTPRRPVGNKTGRPRHSERATWALSWVNLEDLRRGDLVVSLRSLPDDAPMADDPLLADPRFLWLLGLAFGDGFLSPVRRNLVSLCVFGDLRDEVQDRLEDFCGKRGGQNPGAGVRVHSEALAAGLRRYGMDAPSTSRVLPRELWGLPHAGIQAFLDGYTAADGSRSKRQRDPALEYKAANRGLIEDVRNLHMILGHNVTRVREHRRTGPIVIKGREVKNALPLWTFEAYETGVKLATGGISDLRRNADVSRLFPADSHFSPQLVTGIEPAGTEDTYDITVEDTHNFVAEGLVVHNSGFTQGVYAHFGYDAPRTSEEQGAWVQKIGKPQAGGLVFFNSPAGGPPPGHVGIISSATGMISQAGPEGALGPTLGSLSGNMFMGIPPGGFKAAPTGHPIGKAAGGLIYPGGVYDRGGWLPPGASVAVNNTGAPERVLPPGQSGGHTVSVNYYGPQAPTAEQEAAMLMKLAHAVGIAG